MKLPNGLNRKFAVVRTTERVDRVRNNISSILSICVENFFQKNGVHVFIKHAILLNVRVYLTISNREIDLL